MGDPREMSNLVARPDRRSGKSKLSQATLLWLAQLPENLQPRETAARFPHVANRLATVWHAPSASRQYFDELLLDDRGDRQGFPAGVARELVSLKYYYDSLDCHASPASKSAWHLGTHR